MSSGRIGTRKRVLALALLLPLLRTAAAEEPGESTGLLARAGRLYEAGRYLDGIPPAERALALREQVLGPDHPAVAEALNRLGILVHSRGDLPRARALLRRALAIRERRLGPAHLDTLESVHDLGKVLLYSTELGEAEPLLDRALAGRQRLLGPEHPAVAEALATLGTLAGLRGQNERAVDLGRRAIAIYERSPAVHAIALAFQLNNLAIRARIVGGDHVEAEQLFLRAIHLVETSPFPEHPVIGHPIMNIGLIRMRQGDYAQVLPYYLRAQKIHEASGGPTSQAALLARGNLADFYRLQGDYGSAESLYVQLLMDRESALGPAHLMMASSLHDLADVRRHQRRFAEAEALLLRASSIVDSKLAPTYKDQAKILTMLARVYHEQGALEQAEPVYRKAIVAWDAGNSNSLEIPPHGGLAALLERSGRPDESAAILQNRLSHGEWRLRLERRSLSDASLGALLRKLRDEEELAYSLLRRHPGNTALGRLALSFALLRKGRSIEELAGTSRAIARDLSPQDQSLFADLRARYGRLAALSLSGPGKLSHAVYQQTIQELTAKADELERELANRSFRIRAQRSVPRSDEVISRVAAQLPPAAALVEIVAYADIDDRIQRGPLHYLAFVLHQDGKLASADLGPAASIDEAATRLHAALQNPRAPYQAAAQELERRLLQPLRRALGDTRQVFLSPDGALHQIPFAVLRADDSLSFTYLTSGRDLLREAPRQPAITVAVLADPDFRQAAAGPPGRGSAERDRGLSVGQLRPLPGTRAEAEAIRRLLPDARLLLGKEATEGTLLGLRAPGILHIATHGLFLDEAPPPPGSQRGFQLRATTPGNPLLRSALALAGAQQTEQQGNSPDGLATALELSGMDLWGTQLVVLSACETGRGEARMGQGVYGLRRSLAIAGAETLVTSLWKVDDDATKDLMTDYYKGLVAGQGRGAAMTAAMAAMRKRKPHPYYWAPFIVIGQPDPLRGIGQQRPAPTEGP